MSLFSWDYESNHPADEWFRTAHAYADSAVALFEGIASRSLPRDYHHAKVAAAAFGHALELFLKGSFVLKGEKPGVTHNVRGMLQRYRLLYSGKECAFSGRIDEVADEDPDRPLGQFLRYPTDSSGAPWPGHTHFTLDLWVEQVKLFREDFRRLEPLLREQAG